MKSLLLLLFVALCSAEKRQVNNIQSLGFQYGFKESCIADEEVNEAYHHAFDGFAVNLYQTLVAHQKHSYVTSPQSIWTTLAAIAEGADYFTQKELFNVLNLPKELCSRQKFYQIAASRIRSNQYISHARALVIDDNALVNPQWYSLIQQNGLLDVIPAPIKFDVATATEIINKIISPKGQKLDLTGNSVLLNAFDVKGIWNTAFADAEIKQAPFYNANGEQVGTVDLMRVVRKVRIGAVDALNMKVIELPIGVNSEYSMVFALPVGNDVTPAVRGFTDNTILEAINALKESSLPVDIQIPRFTINSELDLKEVLRDMGVYPSVWTSQSATRFVSSPAARPSTYIGRTSLTISNEGINRPTSEYPVYRHASKEELYWSEFIADRPFMFGLFDTETYTSLLSGFFSEATYPLSVSPDKPNVSEEGDISNTESAVNA